MKIFVGDILGKEIHCFFVEHSQGDCKKAFSRVLFLEFFSC